MSKTPDKKKGIKGLPTADDLKIPYGLLKLSEIITARGNHMLKLGLMLKDPNASLRSLMVQAEKSGLNIHFGFIPKDEEAAPALESEARSL